ncbi:MAG: Ubiquinol-cytochrome C reductase, cytochrome B subunit, partial [uncultured Solirubrobacterales bacterium]
DQARGRLLRRSHRRRSRRAQAAALRLPRPLVVPARGDRAQLVPGARGHGDLPHLLLLAERRSDGLQRRLRAAARPEHDRGLLVDAQPLARRARRPAHAPDPPLGGQPDDRRDHRAPAADPAHRCVSPATRDQLRGRRHPAGADRTRGLRRLLIARRPALWDGTRDRLRRGHVDPAARRRPQLPDLGRRVPGQRRVLPAALHRPRAARARRHRRADRRAPGHDRAPAPHAVPRQDRDRAKRRRLSAVARLRAQVGRAAARHRGGAVPARRARADQPDLAVGAVRALPVDQRRAAGLVPGLAAGRPAADAGARGPTRQLDARAEPVLGRARLSHARVPDHVRVALDRPSLARRQPTPRAARPPARQPPPHRDRHVVLLVGARGLRRGLDRSPVLPLDDPLRGADLVPADRRLRGAGAHLLRGQAPVRGAARPRAASAARVEREGGAPHAGGRVRDARARRGRAGRRRRQRAAGRPERGAGGGRGHRRAL